MPAERPTEQPAPQALPPRGSSSPLARARTTGLGGPPPRPPRVRRRQPGVQFHDADTDTGTGTDGTAGLLDGDPVVPEFTGEQAAPTTTADAGDPAAATSRAGRNLPAAIAVGAGLGAIILVTLFVYRPSFAVLVGVFVLYGAWEIARVLRGVDVRLALSPVLVGGAAVLAAAWLRGPSGLVLAVLVTAVGILAWRIGDGAEGYARDSAASLFVVLYLPALAAFALLLARPDDGAARVLAFVVTVVLSDTGGYATGVLFGKHPLAPIVSKGKTWEGFAGSVAFCSGGGVLLLTLTFHAAWWQGLLFGLAIVATATLGDLGESMIKRDLGVKDMGSLLPGHGGVMDRLDSLLPCAAVAYLLLSAFAPV